MYGLVDAAALGIGARVALFDAAVDDEDVRSFVAQLLDASWPLRWAIRIAGSGRLGVGTCRSAAYAGDRRISHKCGEERLIDLARAPIAESIEL